MGDARIIAILVASKKRQPMVEVAHATLVAGVGIEGDRYSVGGGSFSKPGDGPGREVTLVEIEALEALQRDHQLEVAPSALRRNLVTRGVALNHLVGRTFHVGDTLLRGVRLCEPCKLLAKSTSTEVMRALVHRGGLRAQIVSGATVRVGDVVTPSDS